MKELTFRKANIKDSELYFKWANDPLVRENSIQQSLITYEDHIIWFGQKLENKSCHFYLFFNAEEVPVGQVRIDQSPEETIIGLSIDSTFRGKGLGAKMLNLACTNFLNLYPTETITAYIKETNIASYKLFRNVGFVESEKKAYNNISLFRLTKEYDERF
ncbi:GNAT family N-acetyltransferase [Daejeonella sp.]|uniref:GNAT family N-acetyltransferase n=1 Tax=Daejeonella sp. TaxID=2805397 RepID=UPI0030C45927